MRVVLVSGGIERRDLTERSIRSDIYCKGGLD